jgi:myo-inositol-1(or 4)-monophosphatase
MTKANGDLELAVAAATVAGEILLGFWRDRSELTISDKRAGDFVSEADTSAEASLKSSLLTARPDDSWLGEESGSVNNGQRRWVVDPLDGTTNFLRGIPHWAVSVALEIEGVPSLGVVHDPLKGETFVAASGHGATLNGEAISGSSTTSFASAVFGTGIPFGEMDNIDDHAADLALLMPRCAGVRRMGSAALDLAYVAAGRLDGFWERRLQLWDIAAGLVLLQEAGIHTQGWSESELPEHTGSVIAAPPQLFSAFSHILRRHGQ